MLSLRRHYAISSLRHQSGAVIHWPAHRDARRLADVVFAGCFHSFFAWMGNIRRHRTLQIRRLHGLLQHHRDTWNFLARRTARWIPAIQQTDPTACLWYRYEVERRNARTTGNPSNRAKARTLSCWRMKPANALSDPMKPKSSPPANRPAQGQLPLHGIFIIAARCALCPWRTRHSRRHNSDLSIKEDVSALLAEWKQDKRQLLTRFDLNHDGEIDLQEWNWHARLRARGRSTTPGNPPEDGVHVMRSRLTAGCFWF